MEVLLEYGLFLAKAVTILAFLLVVLGVIFSAQRQKEHEPGHIEVKNLNDALDAITHSLKEVILYPEARKQNAKDEKKRAKEKQKELKRESKANSHRSRMFVLDFDGDVQASAVGNLREEITAVLAVAEDDDEVLIRLESPGGVVHGYGLAASQLQRIRRRGLQLTVAVDKVAASGGYMMACIGHQIMAAPFAVLGSIGVVAQLPNFHRLLKKNEIDFEVLTAGEHKRTLTVFGENTEQGREKFLEELEDVHKLFKDFVAENRPAVDIEAVATGEAWFGKRALEHQLVDELKTSDELIVEKCAEMDVFQVRYVQHKHRIDKLLDRVAKVLGPRTVASHPSDYLS